MVFGQSSLMHSNVRRGQEFLCRSQAPLACLAQQLLDQVLPFLVGMFNWLISKAASFLKELPYLRSSSEMQDALIHACQNSGSLSLRKNFLIWVFVNQIFRKTLNFLFMRYFNLCAQRACVGLCFPYVQNWLVSSVPYTTALQQGICVHKDKTGDLSFTVIGV